MFHTQKQHTSTIKVQELYITQLLQRSKRQNNAPLFNFLMQTIKDITSLHENDAIQYWGGQTKVHRLVSCFCKCSFIRTQSCPLVYATPMAVSPPMTEQRSCNRHPKATRVNPKIFTVWLLKEKSLLTSYLHIF